MPEVSVPLLGEGFNGQSAHDFRVKPTLPGDLRRSTLQLRPGEPFYVQDLCLTLVPEKSHEHLVHLAAGGVVPSYEDYSQHVSQLRESQDLLSPSRILRRPHSNTLQTPTKKLNTPRRTPLFREVAANPIDINGDSQEFSQDAEKRAIWDALKDSNGYIDDRLLEDSCRTDDSENNVSGTINKPDNSTQSSIAPRNALNVSDPNKDITAEGLTIRTSVPNSEVNQVSQHCSSEQQGDMGSVSLPVRPTVALVDPQPLREDGFLDCMEEDEREPLRKRRRTSPNRRVTEESQDSLAGRTIEVAVPMSMTPKTPVESPSSISSQRATVHPRTPSMNASVQGSPSTVFAATCSIRSARSAIRENSFHSSSQEKGLRILFASSTSVGDSKASKKFLAEHGVKIVQNIKDATCLCVGKGELKKTSKLISAVLFGLDIVTEDWVTDSVRLKKIQDLQPYLARDPRTESDWGINLDEAIERGKQKGRVFQGWDVVFTAKAKKELGKTGFDDLKEIVSCAGANKVGTSLPKTSTDEGPPTLIIASPEDANAPSLKERRYFTKDIIGLSVLRGQLDLESDEFLVRALPQQKGNNKRKR